MSRLRNAVKPSPEQREIIDEIVKEDDGIVRINKIRRALKISQKNTRILVEAAGYTILDRKETIKALRSYKIPSDLIEICKAFKRANALSLKNLAAYYDTPIGPVSRWCKEMNITLGQHQKFPLPLDFNEQFKIHEGVNSLARYYKVNGCIISKWLKQSNLKYPEYVPLLSEDELIELHYNQKFNLSEIAQKFGTKRHIIQNLMRKYKIKTSNVLITKEELIDLHHNQKKSQHAIAYELGVHQTTISNYMKRHGIEVRNFKGPSLEELQMRNFLYELGFTDNDLSFNDKQIMNLGQKEIDIFIPSHNLGIEVCGLRFHSEMLQASQIAKHMHAIKYNKMNEIGSSLITLFADEWYSKEEIVKSIIRNRLGMTPNKIFARKCEMKEIDSLSANLFYQENHIQGRTGRNLKNLGLFFKGELVAAMTIGLHPANKNIEVLSRFCTKLNTNVIGAASKLFKHISQDYKELISWSDNRWTTGGIYESLGFIRCKDEPVSYSYALRGMRERRSRYQSTKKRIGCPKHIKEHEFMEEMGHFRIWDCGRKEWKWKKGA